MVFLSIGDKDSINIISKICILKETIPTGAVRIALQYYNDKILSGQYETEEEALADLNETKNQIEKLISKKKKIEQLIEQNKQNNLKDKTEL